MSFVYFTRHSLSRRIINEIFTGPRVYNRDVNLLPADDKLRGFRICNYVSMY